MMVVRALLSLAHWKCALRGGYHVSDPYRGIVRLVADGVEVGQTVECGCRIVGVSE